MDYRVALEIWVQIEESSLDGLKKDLIRKAVEYAHIRANWALMDSETRIERDRMRTAAHNAFIDSCNILSRNMREKGEDNHWRARMTDDRKEIGDFACWLHAMLGIQSR